MRSHEFSILHGQTPWCAVSPDDPGFVRWKRDCEALIKKVYGASSTEFVDFRAIRFEHRGVHAVMTGVDVSSLFRQALEHAQQHLDSFFNEQLKNEAEEQFVPVTERPSRSPRNNKVFVVHGHDTTLKTQVARTLEKLKLEPIILHEAPDLGRTIIDKLDAHSDVGFAVVLLTPDDKIADGSTGGRTMYRARQNVVFEYGFFFARLGRGGVMALRAADVEAFSDTHGVLYTEVDAAEAWRLKLARELKAAGYDVDLNRLA